MTKTKQMQERDKRMFGTEVRDRVYQGDDASHTSKGEIGLAAPADHGVRPLIGKFSTLNLSRLNPTQRKLLVEQVKFEMGLSGQELNDYLSQRYDKDDEQAAWLIVNKASKRRKKKLGVSTAHLKERKRQISLKQQRKLSPEKEAERQRKRRETIERNKHDPNYVSYGTLKKEHLKRQKLLAARYEQRLKEAAAVHAEPTIKREVRRRTLKLELENQRLKEYLQQNGMPLPGTKAAKNRREELRRGED